MKGLVTYYSWRGAVGMHELGFEGTMLDTTEILDDI